MIKYWKVIILLSILTSCESDKYTNDLIEYREQKDRQLMVLETSPIPAFKRSYFEGLKYFEVNKEGLVKASFQEFSKKDTILFDIGTGEMEQYIKKGKLTFTINNVNLSLTAFQGNGSNVNRIFIPFADLTSGVSTYGSGRYLYSVVKDGKADLDFNYASNPYCAYNEEYVCFPAPDENILDVKIEIGEKLYH